MALKKRFQIFVSSTFADLRHERDEIANALQAMGHIPAGMELFGSDADDSWTVIERTIDLSDYFVLVIAGRYGSISEVGISFTEREFDHATANKIPVLAFVHEDLDKLPSGVVEKTAKAQRQLKAFRKKVTQKHQVTFWSDKADLSTKVVASLAKTIEMIPRPGWVRGDIEKEIRSLGTEKYSLQERIRTLEEEVRVKNALLQSVSSDGKADSALNAITTELPLYGRIFGAEIDMPSLAARLYSFQVRLLSPYLFSFACYAIARVTARDENGRASHGVREKDDLSQAEYCFRKEQTLAPEFLAEIATSALASGLIVSDRIEPEQFEGYWQQSPWGKETPIIASIPDTCWSNCAKHYVDLPIEMRPEMNPKETANWKEWSHNSTRHSHRGQGSF